MTSLAASAVTKPSRHAFTFILITVLLDMIGFGLITPVLPNLIQTVGHMTLAEASLVSGWMFFAYSAAQFFFGPLMGNLSDTFGRRPLLLLSIGGLAIDYVLQAVAPSLFWLYVARAISGVCGASWIIANAYIADITAPEERAKHYGMMGAAFGLGFVLGPAIGGLLGEFGPRVPFYVAAGISTINLIYGYFVLPETLEPKHRRPFEWGRANPFGAFRIFRSYHGVVPMCIVLFSFFFFSSVYPAIWPYWGMAKFGWSPAVVGVTLAVFGIAMAASQAGLTGPLVKRFGEWNVALFGMSAAILAAGGYGLAGGLGMVIVLILVHTPEGFIHPMLMTMMTKNVPENAQGELQGGVAALLNVSQLAGTVFFSQMFGYFMGPNAPFQSPSMGFFIAAGGLVMTMGLFLALVRRPTA
jgi:DHA1 family tetracycline resistance protein-like MFS transporter